VTTDPEIAAAFWEWHGAVIYRSLSGVRSIVAKLRSDDRTRWGDIATCPVQFQQFIPGTDFRVHVVGEEPFIARFDSEADDYRYARCGGSTTHIAKANLPDDVADRCKLLTKSQGLAVSGIDLRRTPAGEWFCFEVNPSPAFSYFDLDGTPIAAAVARLLLQGPDRSDPGREEDD
jgi:glutathione synthase/RimK-type ligase-like ATP-grasp enzyme